MAQKPLTTSEVSRSHFTQALSGRLITVIIEVDTGQYVVYCDLRQIIGKKLIYNGTHGRWIDY